MQLGSFFIYIVYNFYIRGTLDECAAAHLFSDTIFMNTPDVISVLAPC
jgi:hypothetical protein